jgi:hypothetical protein
MGQAGLPVTDWSTVEWPAGLPAACEGFAYSKAVAQGGGAGYGTALKLPPYVFVTIPCVCFSEIQRCRTR